MDSAVVIPSIIFFCLRYEEFLGCVFFAQYSGIPENKKSLSRYDTSILTLPESKLLYLKTKK